MKKIFLLASTCFTLALATAGHAETYRIDLDWKKPVTLNDGVALMCDDSYYTGMEVVIPGKDGKDFQITMEVDIGDGKLRQDCKITKIEGKKTTTYIFEDPALSCTIRVDKVRKDYSEKPQHADYSVSDAC